MAHSYIARKFLGMYSTRKRAIRYLPRNNQTRDSLHSCIAISCRRSLDLKRCSSLDSLSYYYNQLSLHALELRYGNASLNTLREGSYTRAICALRTVRCVCYALWVVRV